MNKLVLACGIALLVWAAAADPNKPNAAVAPTPKATGVRQIAPGVTLLAPRWDFVMFRRDTVACGDIKHTFDQGRAWALAAEDSKLDQPRCAKFPAGDDWWHVHGEASAADPALIKLILCFTSGFLRTPPSVCYLALVDEDKVCGMTEAELQKSGRWPACPLQQGRIKR